MSLLFRDNTGTCGGLANLTACASNIPFCCPTSATCITLTPSLSSVICCPPGESCIYIEPVTCDIALQNATAYPYNTLHTTQLNATLSSCGRQCCPLGYACQDDVCMMTSRHVASTTGATSSTATSAASTLSTSISIIIASSVSVPDDPNSSSSYPARAIGLGLLAGSLLGIVLTLLVFFMMRKHRQKEERKTKARHSAEIFGGKTPLGVSDPIFTPESAHTLRTDFLRQPESERTLVPRDLKNPQTPQSQMTVARGGGLPPLFTSPLRFGLPVTPSPTTTRKPRNNDQMPVTVPYSDGLLSQLAVAVSAPIENPDNRAACKRQNSDDSYISTGRSTPRTNLSRHSSSGTINVLMPPPSFAEGGPRGQRGVSTNTTFAMMMEGAGMRNI